MGDLSLVKQERILLMWDVTKWPKEFIKAQVGTVGNVTQTTWVWVWGQIWVICFTFLRVCFLAFRLGKDPCAHLPTFYSLSNPPVSLLLAYPSPTRPPCLMGITGLLSQHLDSHGESWHWHISPNAEILFLVFIFWLVFHRALCHMATEYMFKGKLHMDTLVTRGSKFQPTAQPRKHRCPGTQPTSLVMEHPQPYEA